MVAHPGGCSDCDSSTRSIRSKLLQQVVARYAERTGRKPQQWSDLVNAGLLRGIPLDPDGHPFQLESATGRVTLDRSLRSQSTAS